MALNLSAADAALKDIYLPVIREQLNQKNWFLQQIESNGLDVEGRKAVLALHVSRNSGVGARGDGDTLPTAGNQGTATEYVSVKTTYGRLQLTGPTMRAMKSDKGSFTRAMEYESKGLVNDAHRDVSRQLFGTSNGVIANCATSTATTTINLTAATATQLRQLEVGMLVDIGTVASPTTIASARTIVSVGSTSLVISGANVTTSSSHYIFRSGAGGTGAAQKELTGLQTIVDSTGTLFNVDPSTYPSWASYENSNSGTNRSVTDSLFEAALDAVDIASGEFPDMIVASHGVVRNYAASLKDQKRFSNTTELKGGFKAAVIDTPDGSIPLMKDRDCPNNTAFILNTKHLKFHTQSGWDWMQEDGAVLSRVLNVDAYEATLYRDAELTTDRRNAHGKLLDLSES